jgi:hypothetical protein
MFPITSSAVLCLLVLNTGCYSGGGSKHAPPVVIYYDEDSVLTFEFVVVGSVGKGVEKRYTDEKAFFRMKGEQDYRPAKTSRKVVSGSKMLVQVIIPPIEDKDGDMLEYYVEISFDGHSNFIGRSDMPKTVKVTHRVK